MKRLQINFREIYNFIDTELSLRNVSNKGEQVLISWIDVTSSNNNLPFI
jgi:hypothetical protein